jgi:hypothetical protein
MRPYQRRRLGHLDPDQRGREFDQITIVTVDKLAQ